MKDIFLIRHGRQCSKLCNVDVSLDESGRKQAKLAGKRLISYQLEKLYCSQLIRAKETAEIIGHCVNLPVEEVADIEEIHFGGFTGKTDEQIRTEYAAKNQTNLSKRGKQSCYCNAWRRNTLGVCRYSSYRSGEQIKIWNRPRKYKFYPFDLR